MSEFMLASCHAGEFLKGGDVITANGIDYIYKEVSDWAYLYSDKDERISPLDVTHVNGYDKRFGTDGIIDFILDLVKSNMYSSEEMHNMLKCYALQVYSLYLNMDHPKNKEAFKWLLEITNMNEVNLKYVEELPK